jgi:hypothetical protein
MTVMRFVRSVLGWFSRTSEEAPAAPAGEETQNAEQKRESTAMHAPEPDARVVVALADVVNEMAEQSDHRPAFLNRRTGELIALTEAQLRTLEDPYADESGGAEVGAALQQAFKEEDLLELPNSFDTQEYSLREKFCDEVKSPEQAEQLRDALRGKQAFRTYDLTLRRLDIREQWEHYRDRAFEVIAVKWLDKHGISYERGRAKAA